MPEGLDWDFWCGPVEPIPYNAAICSPRSRPGWLSCRAFSGGEMTGWGAHGVDQIQWALGMDDSGPAEVWVEGPKFNPPTYTEPESAGRGNRLCSSPKILYRYANGVVVELDKGNHGGGIFIGDKGKIDIFRNKVTSNPAEIVNEPTKDNEIHLYKSDNHMQNWMECIKTREKCVADAEVGHRSITVCHLGNIARWLNRKLRWDPAKEVFPDDAEANTYLDRKRRKGYELPETV